jgi:hypothetical protein
MTPVAIQVPSLPSTSDKTVETETLAAINYPGFSGESSNLVALFGVLGYARNVGGK